jgi:hypothetical protein
VGSFLWEGRSAPRPMLVLSGSGRPAERASHGWVCRDAAPIASPGGRRARASGFHGHRLDRSATLM